MCLIDEMVMRYYDLNPSISEVCFYMAEDFRTKLKRIRVERGLTQEQLGALTGLTYVAIGDWERGKRNPRRENVKAIAIALGVQEGELLLSAGFVPDEASQMRDSIIDPQTYEGFDDLDDDLKDDVREDVSFAVQRAMNKQRRRENLGGSSAGGIE
jgi:transcriptional regulator with XRE-family HTH domain